MAEGLCQGGDDLPLALCANCRASQADRLWPFRWWNGFGARTVFAIIGATTVLLAVTGPGRPPTRARCHMSTASPELRAEIRRALARSAAAAMFVVLTIAFLIEPTWIERVFAAEPDGGTGEAEWMLAAAAGLVALATSISAGVAWRRVAAVRT